MANGACRQELILDSRYIVNSPVSLRFTSVQYCNCSMIYRN